MAVNDLSGWAAGLDDLMARIAGRFRRVEPRRRARAYVLGLLSPLAGKNGWTLVEAAGENTPDGMQRLLNRAAWDADAVRDDLRDYVAEHLGDANAILIIDETGFLKKGTKSAGVQRQYSGTAGRTENCQLGVFLAYASAHGRTLVDRELYLPQGWCHDDARRTEAAVPAKVRFATKPALQMLRRALDAGLPARWVTADETYGKDSKFRLWLQSQRMGYVLAVACNQKIPTDGGSARADELAAAAPAPAWKRRSCGAGAKGPRLFDWAVATLPDTGTAEHGFTRWLLIRRSIIDPTEHAYYLCYGPADTNDEELIRVAGTRWAIEECFQTAKGQVGLDDYQVRRYDAWYRHITLVPVPGAGSYRRRMPELIAPTVSLHTAWLDARDEWGPGVHEDGFGLRPSDEVDSPAGFAAFVARLVEQSDPAKPLDAGRVRCTHRWIVEGDQVLGGIALRHELNDFLLRIGGHIGYGIRPSARGRGLATWALGRMLGEARALGLDRVLVTCESGNVASAKTIERHGAVLEDVRDTELGTVRRYWIKL